MSRTTLKEFFFVTMPVATLLYLVINFLFVFYSKDVVPRLPRALIPRLDGCYQTLYHTDLSEITAGDDGEVVVVLGDSFGAGAGDEFNRNDENPGFVRKLQNSMNVNAQFLVYARSGFGSISSLNEYKSCSQFLYRMTSLHIGEQEIDRILLMFYEGNDLDNNLVEKEVIKSSMSWRRKLRLYLPLVDLLRQLPELIQKNFPATTSNETTKQNKNITRNGIEVPGYPQGASVELSPTELDTALDVFEEVLTELRELHSQSEIDVLYLPAVSTVYDFEDPLRVRSYKGLEFFETTNESNLANSDMIRALVYTLCDAIDGCVMCDTTEDLRSQHLNLNRALHGPTDWAHFNQLGYSIVADRYGQCLSN